MLALLLTLVYGHTFKFPFQFDDYNVIVDEPKVHSLGAWWQSMPGMRPLLKLTYALNWQFEASPRFFRLFNLICHFFTSILVWQFSKEILLFLLKNTQNINKIAMLAALLFALHPAHSEVVTYISCRSTGLMALLYMLSLTCWLQYLKSSHKAHRYLFSSIFLWIVAVLVKEPALAFPLLAWLVALSVKPQLSLVNVFRNTRHVNKIAIFTILIALAAYVVITPQYLKLLTQTFTFSSLQSQLATQPSAHWHYLTQTLLGLNLSVDYELALVQNLSVKSMLLATSIFALIAFCLLRFKQWPLLSFCILWWFICLTPSNSFIPRLDIVNDRQIYLASIGALMLAAVGILQLATYLSVKSIALRMVVYALTASWILAMGAATWLRNWDYESEVSLWQANIKQQPNNARAWNNLGYAFMQAKQDENAIHAFENALELDQTNVKAFYNLQQLLKNQENNG